MENFAIITAWNPHSCRASDSENKQANASLLRKLQNFNYCKLLVGDLKRIWLEESFAVEIPQNLALELAVHYKQNAIYYVHNDRLYLISCIENSVSEKIGYLSQKIIM